MADSPRSWAYQQCIAQHWTVSSPFSLYNVLVCMHVPTIYIQHTLATNRRWCGRRFARLPLCHICCLVRVLIIWEKVEGVTVAQDRVVGPPGAAVEYGLLWAVLWVDTVRPPWPRVAGALQAEGGPQVEAPPRVEVPPRVEALPQVEAQPRVEESRWPGLPRGMGSLQTVP